MSEARQAGPGSFVVTGGIAVLIALASLYWAGDRAAWEDEAFWATASVAAWTLQALLSFGIASLVATRPVGRPLRVLVAVTPLVGIATACAFGGALPGGAGIFLVWAPLAIVGCILMITGFLGAR